MANERAVANLKRAEENYSRIWLLVTECVANPTQSNIDAIVLAAAATGVVQPKVSHSVDGEQYSWTEYQQALGKIMEDLRKQIIRLQGPFFRHAVNY